MLKASYPQHYLSHLQNEAGRPTLPLHQKGIRDPHLWGTGKCLTLGLTAARWILTPGHTGSEQFISGSNPFPGPVLACTTGGQRDAGPTQGRERGRNLVVPCHTRPGSPKRLQHKGGPLPKQFKTGFWCVAVATTPAARQLRRRSKRRQGYSLRGWGGGGKHGGKSHSAQAPRQRVAMTGGREGND